ncbi:VOC family protein [Salinivibrio sp. IB872]|uniref:VOC family protein n=1 Tax=Salinivibrio sp. IB872 TaxID=1766123 RepID=UPI00130156A9|nr:VOC family protein [Salinivibrio sp. IB872]
MKRATFNLKEVTMHDATNLTTLMRDKAAFADKINQLLDLLAIDCAELTLDHVAIRTHEIAVTESLATELASQGKLCSEAIVNGRPIHIYALERALTIGQWQTHWVELPFPNHKRYPRQSWEHVEFVLPCATADMAGLKQALKRAFPGIFARAEQQHTITVKCSEPCVKGERLPNPTIAFKYQDVCVKFHPFPLAEIIASEASD